MPATSHPSLDVIPSTRMPSAGRRRPASLVLGVISSALLLVIFGALPAGAIGQIGAYTVPIHSFGLAISPDGTTIYSTATDDGQLNIIDVATGTITQTIPVGNAPAGIAVSPDGSRVYVANGASDTVSVIVAGAVVDTIAAGNGPNSMAVSPDGDLLYVANSGSNDVIAIDTATNTVIQTVPVGSNPRGLAITPDGQRLYVANAGSDSVTVIDTATHTVINTITVGSIPQGLAISSDGNTVVVTNEDSNTVSIISTATNTVTAQVPVGGDPYAVAISPDSEYAFVANSSVNSVSIIALAGSTVVDTFYNNGPTALVMSPDGDTLYITEGNSTQIDVFSRILGQVSSADGTGSYGELFIGGVAFDRVSGDLQVTTTTSSPHVTVSGNGLVSSPPTTPVGSYTVSGTATTTAGDHGTWTFTLQVTKADQTVDFTSTAPSPAAVGGSTYEPTATASSGLPVTFSIDPSSSDVCSIAGGAVTFTAVGDCLVLAAQGGDDNWNAASPESQTIAVGKGAQTVAFDTDAPTDATVGGATYSPEASASSGLPVSITVSPATAGVCSISSGAVSFQAAGDCTVRAAQAGDDNWEAATTVSQTFTVGKASQTVSFTSDAPTDAAVAGPTYTPAATATSGLPVTITVDPDSDAVCSIASGVVTFTAAGDCTLLAAQAGNADWNPAQASETVAVGKGAQSVAFTSTAPTDAVVAGAVYEPVAAATSGLPVTITVASESADVCTIDSGVVSFTAAGDCVLLAAQGGDDNWNPAAAVSQPVTVGKGSQTVTFTSDAPTDAVVAGAGYTPTATSSSGLPVVITVDPVSSAVCSIDSGVVSFTASGDCTLLAGQNGDDNWNAAATVSQTVSVDKGSQTVAFTSDAPTDAVVAGAGYTPTATATSGLPVITTVDPASAAVCSIDSGAVSFAAVGDCTLLAAQGGDDNWNPATTVSQTVPVGKGSQAVAFTSAAPEDAVVTGAGYTPTATATSGLPVIITVDPASAEVCGIDSGVVTFTGAGDCTLLAAQAGDDNWEPASTVSQTVAVGKGSQTVAFSTDAPSDSSVNEAGYRPAATATSGLVPVISIDPSSSKVCKISDGLVTFTEAGTCIISAAQAGDDNWLAAPPVTQTITVHPAMSIVGDLPDGTVGAPYRATLQVSGGYPPYTWRLVAGSTLPPGLTLSAAGVVSGTPTVDGTYSFSIEVNDPVIKKFTIVVHPAPVTSTPRPVAPAPGLADTGAPAGGVLPIGVAVLLLGSLTLGAARIRRNS